MRRGPDAHERNDTEGSTPPPPFNIFARLPQTPLTPADPAPGQPTESAPASNRSPEALPGNSVKDARPLSPPGPDGRRRLIIAIILALLIAGIAIGMALF